MERLEGGAKKKKQKTHSVACFGDATHTSLVYTQKAEMAPVTTGVLSSTKCVLLLREIVESFFFFFFGCTKLFGLPKRCTVAELLHIAYDGDNDLLHIGIILLCEVLAPSLLNMHECLK